MYSNVVSPFSPHNFKSNIPLNLLRYLSHSFIGNFRPLRCIQVVVSLVLLSCSFIVVFIYNSCVRDIEKKNKKIIWQQFEIMSVNSVASTYKVKHVYGIVVYILNRGRENKFKKTLSSCLAGPMCVVIRSVECRQRRFKNAC